MADEEQPPFNPISYWHGDESTRGLHVWNVYEDPDFANAAKQINDNASSDYKSLRHDLQAIADKFCITYDEAIYFLVGDWETMPVPRERAFKVNWDEYQDENTDKITITFSIATRKEELMEVWDIIQEKPSKHRGQATKRKPLENHELVYAVFKARQKGRKFSDIFKDYQSGTLDGYSGSTSQYDTDDSLERYYRRYDPAKLEPEPLHEAILQIIKQFGSKYTETDT